MAISIAMLVALYMGKDSSEYIQACSQAGLLYEKAGLLDKAAQMLEEGLTLSQGKQEHLRVRQVQLNNFGSLLLKLGHLEDARHFLEESLSLAELMGGIPLAEPRKNLARYFLLKGNRVRAKELYLQVYPVFQEKYGPTHSKNLEVEEEMKALEN